MSKRMMMCRAPQQARRVVTLGLGLCLGLGLIACGKSDPAGDTDPGAQTQGGGSDGSQGTPGSQGTDDPGSVVETPTYYQHVAPIYARRCVGCHQPNGAGPFPLNNYASAKEMARASAHAVKAKTMPPWLVRDDGSCGQYKDSQALTATEIETIDRWAQTGAPMGQEVAIEFPPVKSLRDYVEASIPAYVPTAEGSELAKTDEYRCFFLKNPTTDKRRYLNGYEVIPGNAALVHHAVMFVIPSKNSAPGGKTADAYLREIDEKSPDKPGWPCYGSVAPGVNPVDLPVVWAPGQGAVELAPKTGSIIDPDDLLVLQVHYNLADPKVVGQSDQTTLRMQLIDSIERQSLGFPWDDLIETLRDKPTIIPAGQEAFEYKSDLSFEGLGFSGLPFVDIQGFMPHMHGAGKSQTLELLEKDAPRCLSDVPRWDFDWQLAYFYQEPIRLLPGQKLRNTCIFNTVNRSEPTSPGWGTRNEMCLATMFMLMPPGFETR